MVYRILIAAMIAMVIAPISAQAATVSITLQNYFYAHANTPGVFSFKDKHGSTVQYGDGIEFDATIVSFDVEAYGMAVGDTITAYSSGGASYPVTPGQTTTVSIGPTHSLSIKLNKTGTNEVYARVDVLRVYDQSDGGTDVIYTYSLNNMPSEYGDLGPGSSNPQTVPGNHYYFPPRDAYKYDYTVPSGATRYELHYLDSNGYTQYKRDYEQVPTGVHYLTCNGTYEMRYFDSNGTLIGKSPHMDTTDIIDPTCSSFSGSGSGFNDFPVNKTPNGSGKAVLDWDDVPGTDKYEIYRNGSKIGETTDTTYEIDDDGAAYTVVAKDGSSVIGQTDIPAEGSNSGSGCDGCKLLMDMLACPGWSQYMSSLTGAIQAALPPPPDWDLIADKIGAATVGHLANYLGNVPAPPTAAEIDTNTYQSMPTVDNSVPAAEQLTPTVPSDFNTPKPYNISDGPQITIVDESEPFNILDPLSGMQIDEPGTPVLPGDERNDSGGIKTPDKPDTGGPAIPSMQPTPTDPIPIPSGDPSEVPPTEIPMPSVTPADIPTPGMIDSEIPIPHVLGEGG